jgi:radical SAM superfamily enzyme YgiQ (UPF0313 family)
VPYEPLYFNMVRALLSLGIEPRRDTRQLDAPMIIIGGVAPTLNPAIASVIADNVYLGEAETAVTETIRQTVKNRGAARRLTPMTGIPIPETPQAAPRYFIPAHMITSVCCDGFDDPSRSIFQGAGLVEVGRGCSRGCRFCAAGQIYLPVRHRSVSAILHDVETYRGKAKRIALVGASLSDHESLKEIIRGIMSRGFGLTTSSFRADMLEDEMALLLRKGGMRTITIAPEGGSDRMRKIINKHLTDSEILSAVSACSNAGILSLRLYFMVGLPWERDSDITAIVDLTRTIKKEFYGKSRRITVSINPFIPKPQTPFQWCPMAEPQYLRNVYKYLDKSFREIGSIAVKKMSIREAQREALLSLGDKSVGDAVILNVQEKVSWKKALEENKVDVKRLTLTQKGPGEVFPWDSFVPQKNKIALRTLFERSQTIADQG